jgi:hypothetical protein
VPEPVKVTLPSLMVQPVDELSVVFTTASPEVAEAPGEYDPPVLPDEGAALALMVLEE